jgi:transposase
MVELRNLRKLHAHDRKQITVLKLENKQLWSLVVELRQQNATQAIQIAELQTMVFGKKKPPTGTVVPVLPVLSPLPRTKDSYRRPVPPASTITAEVVLPLPNICACGGSFDETNMTTHVRYEEDIPLPELTPNYQPKLVTKYTIQQGHCCRCGKATAAKELGGAIVSLGPNVRLLVAHLISVGGMSYQQVINLLQTLYDLTFSKGELAGILQTQHQMWLPSYQKLKATIRAAPIVHVDETPWAIQANNRLGYAWVLADASSPSVCYELAQSRGATYARSLFGQDTDQPFSGIRISDDYGPYRNPRLPGRQQLCWAHLYRAIRDTRYNANLPKEQMPFVTEWYKAFATIYQDLRNCLEQPYDAVVRAEQAGKLWQRIESLTKQAIPKEGEPQKLTRLKHQLIRAGQDRLFTCLTKDTPCDNNRAERELRQLVLKRKRSFGSQTEKGATALATILSVCTTTWRIQTQGYFAALAALG